METMHKTDKTRQAFRELEAEIEDVYTMSEEAACFRYNVDSKEEIIQMLKEEEKSLIEQIEYEEEELVRKNTPYMTIDPAFLTMADFEKMRV